MGLMSMKLPPLANHGVSPKARMAMKARPPARRRPRSALERRLKVGGIAFAIALTLGGASYWSFASGWAGGLYDVAHYAVLNATAQAGFSLRELKVEGRIETSKDDILAAVAAGKGDPILGLDIKAVRERLVALPWIVEASVERRFPDELVVSVKEAEPMALWQKKQQLYLVSRDGDVIEAANIKKYAKLLIIVGEDAPQHAQPLFDMLALEPELRGHVTAAVFVGKRRWNVRLDNGIDVKLPEEGAPDAWKLLADLDRQHQLLGKNIVAIDLRSPDKVVVRQAPTAPVSSDGAPVDGTQPSAAQPTGAPGGVIPVKSNET